MQDVVLVEKLDAEAELDRLAGYYRSAGGPGVKLLNSLGGSADLCWSICLSLSGWV